MSRHVTLGISQAHTLSTVSETLRALTATAHAAAAKEIDILLFPEAYLGGYPRGCSFGAAVGARSEEGREQFLQYWKSSVDLGDTPAGAGEAWIMRTLERVRDDEEEGDNKDSSKKKERGDGTREVLEKVARETGVFLVVGLVERAGGSLYCGCVYVDPRRGVVGKRRKVMPTGSERLVWAQGAPSTLKAVVANVRGIRITLAAAICWENYMPLLRYSLYAQNVNLWLAPTADGRDTWEALMRTVAREGRCFVLSANQCVRQRDLPSWITGKDGRGGHQGEAWKKKDRMNNGAASMVASVTRTSTAGAVVEGEKLGRRRSMTAKTVDNHEIIWKYKDPEVENGENEDSTTTALAPDAPDAAIEFSGLRSLKEDEEGGGEDGGEEWASRGGSCIIGPMGEIIAGPLWEVDEGEESLIYARVDLDDCERGRMDFDAAGSYSRSDAFKLTVEGLDLNPPQ